MQNLMLNILEMPGNDRSVCHFLNLKQVDCPMGLMVTLRQSRELHSLLCSRYLEARVC